MKHYAYHKVKGSSKRQPRHAKTTMYLEVHTLADTNLRLKRFGGTMLLIMPLGHHNVLTPSHSA